MFLEEEDIILVDLFLYLFCLDFCFFCCFLDFCLYDDDVDFFTLLVVDDVDWPFICVVDVDLSATVADMNNASDDMSSPFCCCCLIICGYDSQLMPLLLSMDGCDGAISASARSFILPH